MKAKVTSREVEFNFGDRIQKVPYCTMFYLLEEGPRNPHFYHSNKCGHLYDVYTNDDYPAFCITTGAGPIGEYILSYEELKEWNKKASATHSYDELRDLYNALFKAICDRYWSTKEI